MNDKKIILLVDDDDDDRFFFKGAIDNLGDQYTLIEAIHGLAGINKLNDMQPLPDFIFVDINMPYMDGTLFLSEVKNDDRFKDIPVIIYTTSNSQLDKNATQKLGAAHFMTKLNDITNLHLEIAKAIDTIMALEVGK